MFKRRNGMSLFMESFTRSLEKTPAVKTKKIPLQLTAKEIEAQKTKDINKFIYEWIKLMAFSHLDNDLDETFSLTEIEKTDYGYTCNINMADGLSFATLESESMVKTIEGNLGCKFLTESFGKKKHLKATFIMSEIPSIKFEPYVDSKGKKLPPYDLYLGTSIDGTPILASMLKYPHVIVQGSTNMGKTKLIDSICTNLIVSNSPEDVALYFIQVDKSDQITYRRCRHTRAYANDIYKALAITNYLKELVEHRDKVLQPLIEECVCTNIQDFNQIYKRYKLQRFNFVYLVIDEYSSLMPNSEGGDKDKKAIKVEIQENMEKLIQIGRYVGIYIIIGLQRSTVDKLPSFVKALCNTVVTFHVNNVRSSQVAIDSNEAVDLLPREFIVKTDKQIYGKTTTIYPSTILKYITPFKCSPAQYHDFNYISWFDPNAETKKEKKKKETKESKNKQRKAARGYGKDDKQFNKDEINNLVNQFNSGRV